MSRRGLPLAVVAVVTVLAAAAAAAATAEAPRRVAGQEPELHPTFALLDDAGRNVLESGRPVSPMRTCGECHDTRFIAETSGHADAGLSHLAPAGTVVGGRAWDTGTGFFGRWDPTTYGLLTPPGDEEIDYGTADWIRRFGARHVGGGPADTSRDGRPLTDLAVEPGDPETHVLDPASGGWKAWDWEASGVVELNCFLCHLADPDNDARVAELAAGRFAWADTATLSSSGIVSRSGSGWRYEDDAFGPDGQLVKALAQMQDPTDQHCGQCHGLVHADDLEPVVSAGCEPEHWTTERTGQVFSPQRMADSGMNLAGKDELNRSWDAHAERVVACVDCHHSMNNPARAATTDDAEVAHLLYDARRIEIAEYLYRPSHELAGPAAIDASGMTVTEPATVACGSCHDPGAAHGWLPYRDRHFAALDCTACHAATMHAPARRVFDWTVLDLDGRPRVECRGVDGRQGEMGTLISGFEPVLLPRPAADAGAPLAPYNLITSWYWVHGDPERPVRARDLEQAYLVGDAYHPDVVAALDEDGDGTVAAEELVLDAPEEVAAIAGRLEAVGVDGPRIVGEVEPHAIAHSVVGGDWAIRDCQACHSAASRVAQPVSLAAAVPGGVVPSVVPGADTELAGRIVVGNDGLRYEPGTVSESLYVIGHDRVGWIERVGVLAALLTLLGVAAHGGFRAYGAIRRTQHEPRLARVYMYSVYERAWHWLQAAAVAVLILTGAVIHMPERLGALDFQWAVYIHNIVGFVLLANAALAVFYHVASGEIRQFLPEPKGYFQQALQQTEYYLRGIFRGEPHPFEKVPGRKLNPLQQVTYLAILNVLLPVQVVTGVLIWGAQRWPDLAARLGGLTLLAPVHTLAAWLFLAFLLLHIYLTTTGHTPVSSLEAMIVGWEEVEVEDDEP